MDRRYLRSEKLLINAMLALISEKAFAAITLHDIVTRANVARKTFYAHYESKEHLLWHSLEYHFQSLEQTMTDLNPDTLLMNNKPLSYPVFQHVAEYRLFYRTMFEQPDSAAFVYQFWDYLAQQSYRKHQTLREIAPFISVPPELTAEMLAGALLGALRWWLRGTMEETPEQMAYRFSQLMAPGVLQSLGLE
jgi:AcrR family transcriptional regulator